MRTNAFKSALIVALTGTAGACLLGAPPAHAAGACALLSQEEVSALLGAPVNAGEPLGPNVCAWHERDTKNERNVHLSLLTEKMFVAAQTPNPLIPKTPETGVGDEAVFVHPKGMIFSLIVRKGGTYFRVQARSNPRFGANTPEMDSKDQELDRTIARAVLKKL
jgi:hypothetical protein